jgi:hypothetical protein
MDKIKSIMEINEELDQLSSLEIDDKYAKQVEAYRQHIQSILSDDCHTLMYRELRVLYYNVFILWNTHILPIVASLAKNCLEYIDADMDTAIEQKNDRTYEYLEWLKKQCYTVLAQYKKSQDD